MNKACSIFIDNDGPINSKILSYLRDRYDSIMLVGSQMTTKYHAELPYVYYNYIRYEYDIDIIFQNLTDIDKLGDTDHRIGYIYDCSKNNIGYNTVSSLFNKIDLLILDNDTPKELFKDVFNYSKEIVYV